MPEPELRRINRKPLSRREFLRIASLAFVLAACKPISAQVFKATGIPQTPGATATTTSVLQPEGPVLQPTQIVEGPTIPGQTLEIGGTGLELKTISGEELAVRIGAQEKGWQIVTDEKGDSSFFIGYAGPEGKEPQVVVLAQGPQESHWDEQNTLWRNGNQVTVPDVLLPGGWNEEKNIAGPTHEAETVFLFKDDGSYRVAVVYSPDVVAAEIPDKSNLEILPDGSGLFVGDPKNFDLQTGQDMVRDHEGNLRLINSDESYRLMRTSWGIVTSPDQIYQAGAFAGPVEAIPEVPYPQEKLLDTKAADSPIVQFANAFGVKPEEVGNLTPKLLTGVDGKQFIVLTTGDLSATANFDESGTPLLIAEQGENGEWGWSDERITRRIADLTGRKVVSYCFWQKLNDKEYVDFYLNNFNEMRIGDELKHNNIFNENFNWRNVLDDWDSVTNELNSGSVPYDSQIFNQTWLNRANSLISLAERNQMGITGNAFFWLHDIPPALYSDKYTPEEKKRIFEFMVKSKVLKFKEVDSWTAFSEMGAAELWAPENFKTLYKELGGRELLVDIIKWAREINPQIKLIAVEDHLLDANNDATRQSTNGFNQILNYLEQKGVRPEFVESEDNLWTYAPPNPTDVQQIIQMYQSKGYEIYPAEMTISTLPQYPLWSDRPKTLTNPLTQLELFKLMAEIYINSGTGLGLFSGTDNITWIHEIGATQEKPELFADQNNQPKPGMYLFRTILLKLLKN